MRLECTEVSSMFFDPEKLSLWENDPKQLEPLPLVSLRGLFKLPTFSSSIRRNNILDLLVVASSSVEYTFVEAPKGWSFSTISSSALLDPRIASKYLFLWLGCCFIEVW